jgi:MOSC domain-containing protein YiiM
MEERRVRRRYGTNVTVSSNRPSFIKGLELCQNFVLFIERIPVLGQVRQFFPQPSESACGMRLRNWGWSTTLIFALHIAIVSPAGAACKRRDSLAHESGIVVQVNISAGGVPKRPIDAAFVSAPGIEGDQHLYRLHGGPRKALLLMACEFIDALASEGFSVYYGALGENVTTRGLNHLDWRVGQRYRVGSVLIELTERREPCSKLNPYGAGIQKRILRANGESGFYAAVLENGVIRAGDIIRMVDPVVIHART